MARKKMENGSKDNGSKRKPRVRRSFSDELKAGAVRLVLDAGKTVSQVARDLDLTQSALGGWVKQARADRDGGKSTEEKAELARLRKEVRELRMERDILKKPKPSSRSSRRRAPEAQAHRSGEGPTCPCDRARTLLFHALGRAGVR
jgi:transposase